MKLAPRAFYLLACLSLATPLRAEDAPNPLRLLPRQTDLFLKIDQPRRLLETFTNHELVKQLQAIDSVRQLYESTNARRFYQLLAYLEKELGADRFELLDRLAGNGAVLGVKFGPPPVPFVLVIQGKDEPLLRRFFQVGVELVEAELSRQEPKDRPEKDIYRGIEGVHIGKDFYAAVAGTALVVSNKQQALQGALDLLLDGDKNSLAKLAAVADARQCLDESPLAWAWLNFDSVRNLPGAKEVLAVPGNQPQVTVLVSNWLDQVRRAPFLCGGLYARDGGFVLSLRTKSGREGMPSQLVTHVPPAGQPGSRPLLEPKGVLFSTSYFLDIPKFWEHRAKLLNEKQLKDLEEFDKNSGRFLAGIQMSKLLGQVGAYQRIVAVHQAKPAYEKQPNQVIPAFAFVLEMREPEAFSRRAEAALRGAALLATTQVQLRLVEEKHGDRTIVGYRFPEDATVKFDNSNFRFNFSPCFVAVGNQFVVCSTLELCHELVDILEKEAADPDRHGDPSPARTQVYAAGGVKVLEAFQDQLFTQTILDQAIPPDSAKEQVRAFTEWVRRLGVLQLEANYGPQEFRYDIRLRVAH